MTNQVQIDGKLLPVNNGTDPALIRRLGQLAETWPPLVKGTAPILTPMRRPDPGMLRVVNSLHG